MSLDAEQDLGNPNDAPTSNVKLDSTSSAAGGGLIGNDSKYDVRQTVSSHDISEPSGRIVVDMQKDLMSAPERTSAGSGTHRGKCTRGLSFQR